MQSADKLIILDRDGVINHDSDNYIKTLEEWIPYPTAIAAIGQLTRAGFTVAIATNQSGIARGYYNQATLEAMHDRLHKLVNNAGGHITQIEYCPHGPDDMCQCRKPLPGMLQKIQHHLGLECLTGSWMIGDSLRDLQAGEAVGCKVALVRTGKGKKTENTGKGLKNTKVFNDLSEFAEWIIAGTVHKDEC